MSRIYAIIVAAAFIGLLAVGEQEVRPFAESLLPARQWAGPIIEGLGRVIKLETIMPPYSVEKLTTRFSVHTRSGDTFNITYLPMNSSANGKYHFDLELLKSTGFDPAIKTVVMIPGFMTGPNVNWIEKSKKRWLQLEPVNFIHIDWSEANKYIYSTAVANTPLIARQITMLLYYLYSVNGAEFRDPQVTKRIHLVGHSLGAHISGFVGQDFGGQLGRITGLDPAGPSFDKLPNSERLEKTDAKFVDIIHTNGGKIHYLNLVLSAPLSAISKACKKVSFLDSLGKSMGENYSGEGDTAWFGIDQQLGHVDYYANDGKIQPGCSDLLHICDHKRAGHIMEDILKHELELKDRNLARDSNRLLAFEAESYDKFLSGEHLASSSNNCGFALTKTGFSDSLAQKSERMKSCSIPIDLLTPVDDLMSELVSKHNIELDDDNNERKFFFQTLDHSPLVSDHFLLKVYLSLDKLVWNNEHCAVNAELEYKNSKKFKLDLNHLSDKSDVVAIPFIGKNGNYETDENSILSSNILPHKITISIKKAKADGIMGASTNWIKSLFGSKASEKCQLAFKMVEVHPIKSKGGNFAAIYDSAPQDDERQEPMNWYRTEDLESIEMTEKVLLQSDDETSVISIQNFAGFVRE